MATLWGAESGHGLLRVAAPAPTAAVQIDGVSTNRVVTLTSVTSFVPVFATTAIPVAGFTATSLGNAATVLPGSPAVNVALEVIVEAPVL